MQSELSEGQWVSSFEAIMGLAVRGITEADEKDLETRAIVNLRGRSDVFTPNYCGNGFGFHEFTAKQTDSAAQTALNLHDSLRLALKSDLHSIEKFALIPEQVSTISHDINNPTPFCNRIVSNLRIIFFEYIYLLT